jgi:cell wall-associated NlpC family hydrolase
MHDFIRVARLLTLVGLLCILGTTAGYAAFGDTTLKFGMLGNDVIALQTKLNSLGYTVEIIDGIFGNATLQAVLDFQQDHGMGTDGVVGTATFQKFAEAKPLSASYTVQPGDSLYSIAKHYNISVSDLSRANGIGEKTVLQTDQVLTLPAGIRVSRGAAYTNRSKGMQISAVAQRLLHVPYAWAGSSPSGFDCSGFTYYLFAKHGISLPRMADEQFEVGRRVAKQDLLPGDLVFFETYEVGPSHVGIYVGDGQFIHASSGAGEVTITPLSKPYYLARYLGARRLI